MGDVFLRDIDGSIAKWQAIVDGTGSDEGPSNCPLCLRLFYQVFPCLGCPVASYVKATTCKKTPYEHWCVLQVDHTYPYRASTPELVEQAKLEVAFLMEVREWYVKEVVGNV
jgi:hypothetical protein